MSPRQSFLCKFEIFEGQLKHPDDIEQQPSEYTTDDKHGTSVSGFLLLIGRGYQKRIHIKFLAE